MKPKKKKKKNSLFRKAILEIHLWLGLGTGLIVFILSVTGCLFVFHQEFTSVLREENKYVHVQPERLPLDKVWKSTQAHFPEGKTITRAVVPNMPGKSWIFYSYKSNPDALTYFGNVEHYISAYVNPYTGEVLEIYNEKYDFFNIVKFLHWSLLLKTEIGQPIVGWGTFIFVILMITGVVLWWPRNKKENKRAFAFKWKKSTGWKRINYDLHNVLGFYVTSVALILAFTGMVWSFVWFKNLVYVLAAGTTTPPQTEQAVSAYPAVEKAAFPLDKALLEMKRVYPKSAAFSVSPATDSTGVVHGYIQEYEGKYYINHQMQFDQYTGKLLENRPHGDKNFGEKVIHANYDIHVGAILGLPGKILAFFGSLICASLPLTGFLIWFNKQKKKKKRKKKNTKHRLSVSK